MLFTSYSYVDESKPGYQDLTGVYLLAGNAACGPLWQGTRRANANDVMGAVPANYTTLVYNHQQKTTSTQKGGTYAYALGPDGESAGALTCTTLLSAKMLKASGDTYYGCAIGGKRGAAGSTGAAATGLKVTSIAVFDGTLTEEQMKEYRFDSERENATLTVGGATAADVTWSATGNWADGKVATGGIATVVLQGDATVTVDEAVTLDGLKVKGAGTLTLRTAAGVAASAVFFTADETATVVMEDAGLAIEVAQAPLTYDYAVTTTLMPTTYGNGNTYLRGAGAEGARVGMGAGGKVTLTGTEKFWISGKDAVSAVQTDVTLDGATADYGERMSVGRATYVIRGASAVTTERCILSDGQPNRTAVLTLKDTASLTVSGTVSEDTNKSSIMFGHWDGPSTFSIEGGAAFTAASDVLVGKTGNSHTINVGGGTFTARGIKLASNASGTNRLNLNGGVLALGETGVTRYGSVRTMAVTVGGDAELRATAARLPISQAVAVSAEKTLTLAKASGVEAATVALTGALGGAGTVAVSAGVTLDIGTLRPAETTLSFADGAKLSVRQAYAGEAVTVKAAGLTAGAATLLDYSGATVENAGFTQNADGTVTLTPPTPVFTISAETASLSDAGAWSGGSAPEGGMVVLRNETGAEATVTVSEARTFTIVAVVGAGTVRFAGETLTASDSVRVEQGATLVDSGALATPSVFVAAGARLVVEGITENAAISGAGAVETRGDVKMTKNNTFLGGLTVKSGTLSTADQGGFGGLRRDSYDANVTVESGASVDVANTRDYCYAYTIAGKGVPREDGSYSGALQNSGGAIEPRWMQTYKIALSGDALITTDGDWGLVKKAFNPTTLDLGGHRLTKRGAGSFWLVNATAGSGGTFIVEEGTLSFRQKASDLSGKTLKIAGNAKLTFEGNGSLRGVGALRLAPAAGGVTVENAGGIPESIRPVVDGSGLATPRTGESVVLVKGAAGTITAGALDLAFGSRLESPVFSEDGTQLSATVRKPAKFLHYSFDSAADGEPTVTGAKAADSACGIAWWGDKDGGGPFILDVGRNGRSAHVFYKGNGNRFVPYWDRLDPNDRAPNYAGGMTATTVARLMCAGDARRATKAVPVWGLGSTTAGAAQGVGLVAIDEKTVAAVTWNGRDDVKELARVTDIPGLTTRFHFFAIVTDAAGTRLYVDRMEPVAGEAAYENLGGCGQIGSLHGGVVAAYPRVGQDDDGFHLDDWAVYDAALTTGEVREAFRSLCPDGFRLFLR